MEQLIDETSMGRQEDAKDVILKLRCESFGDSLCSTPTLRKLAKSYGKKIIVCSHKPFVFENNPYVKFHIHSDDFKEEFREQYEVLETFLLESNGMQLKYGSVDIRKIHCTNLGFDLRPNEMHCEYHPSPVSFQESDESFLNSESYVVIHISKTWPSRTWSKSNYENLITNINKAGYKVALIGFDQPKEPGSNNYDKSCYNFEDFVFEGVSFLNRTSLDQDFEIIKKANICITCDTGILHLAGCTDTEIIYIGGSIDPALRAPYRHGGQNYKFSFVGGECKIFCGSDIKYCITEHAELNSLPLVAECLEKKPTYECHPTHEQVFKKIAEVNLRNLDEAATSLIPSEKKKDDDLKKVLVDFRTSALGDSLAWIPYVEEYRLKNNCKVYCSTFKNELFEKSYPEINFIEPGEGVEGASDVIKIGWMKDEETGELQPPLDIRNDNLQKTASFLLGLKDNREIKPKIHIENKERQIEGKYVCVATQSTTQAKYWNNKEGWDKVVEYLKSLGYKVVCIDKDRRFGIEGQYNDIPAGTIDKTKENTEDISLQNRITDLYNCEFFIGLPSGLSWLAWALEKEVVMISGFSDPKTEFYTPYRLINRDVCNSCWNKEEFDKGNWNWCPYHEGTEREFECTKKITFEDVKKEIDRAINFVDLKKEGLLTFDGLTQNILRLGDKVDTLDGTADQWQEIFMNRTYETFSPIEKGDVVLDIGANVGFFAAFAMWKGASKCYSIEPVPYNLKVLTNWIKTSKDRDKFFLINKAISDKPLDETAIMNGSKEDCAGIEIIKLSDFFKEHPSENFDFIKIDCEGGEWSVLNNEKELDLLIKKTKKLAIEIHLAKPQIEPEKLGVCSHPHLDFNFDFVDRFIESGFDIKFTSVVFDSTIGKDITSQILNNERLDVSDYNWKRYPSGTPFVDSVTTDSNDNERGVLAHDWYRQIMFFAQKKGEHITFEELTQNILKLNYEKENCPDLSMEWREIFVQKIYETLSPVEVGDVVLDIGAHVGSFSAFAIQNGASKCYSIEPVLKNFEIMSSWMKTSKDRSKLFPINKAIGSNPKMSIPREEDYHEEDYMDLDAIKLSDFFKEHPSENFDFIKIDCEGAEWFIFNNEKELDLLIEKTKKLAMEVHLNLGWDPIAKKDLVNFNFNFDFANKFIKNGFDIKFTSICGLDITSQILNNERVAEEDCLAHDYYRQIMFFAQKK